jgi:NADH-quinone oxidoreductase subunit M
VSAVTDFPWLTVLGAVPLVGTVVLLLVPAGRDQLVKVIALVSSLIVLAGTVVMSTAFKADGARFQLTEHHTWIEQFGANYSLGVDGIGLVLIGLTAVLVPVVILASWWDAEEGKRGVKTFFALLLASETLAIGTFASTDVFLFYVFFEASLVPFYFLIGSYGGPRRSYAAVKFLLYSLLGGLLMLAAVIALYVESTHQLPKGTFDLSTLVSKVHLSNTMQIWLFLGFFIAFAIKAPLWPFHTWLPDAAAEAPTGVAVLLVAVLDKVGTFGFLRYCLPLFPHASRVFAPWILALCVIGIFYGALLAIGQRDLKRFVAYTSVAHFGFIALGIFAFTTTGGSGATLYMVNHGFSTGALFLIVGFLATRRGSRLIEDLGGVGKVAPWLAGVFLIAGLSALSLPGLSTFVSEFLVLVGAFATHRWFAVLATVGIILASVYVLHMYQRTMHGPVARGVEGMRDLTRREAWVIVPVVVFLFALGVYPKPVLDVITPAVGSTLTQVRSHDPRPSVPERSPTSPVAANAGSNGGTK